MKETTTLVRQLILTGIASKTDAQIRAIFWRIGRRLVTALLAPPLVALAGLWLVTYPYPVRGAWADEALSKILSQKYGESVTVKNAVIDQWFHVTFRSLEIRDRKTEKPLIQAESGSIRLCGWRPQKPFEFKTEVELQNADFFKEYYKDLPNLKLWGHFMRKPIEIDEFKFRVQQDKRRTVLEVLRCESSDIRIGGSLEIVQEKITRQNLLVAYSPFLMLRTIL